MPHRSQSIFLLFLLCLTACLPAGPAIPTALAPAISTTQPPATSVAAPTLTRPATAAPTPTPSPIPSFADEMSQRVQPEPWLAWVRQLSGAEPVQLNGQAVTLATRFTPAMFAKGAKNTAFDYVLATLRGWYPDAQISVQPYEMKLRTGDVLRGKNLILDLPGMTAPDEVVVLSAHLDSRADLEESMHLAPGADDNASGSAALLEAARLFREQRFARTLRLIWFTGEEQGLLGSMAYVSALHRPYGIQADINLDMFGYSGEGPGCVEIHAGPEDTHSAALAARFAETFTTLKGSDTSLQGSDSFLSATAAADVLTREATAASDHSSFWQIGVPAIEISENIFGHSEATPPVSQPGSATPLAGAACSTPAMNPNYHTAQDTVSGIDAAYAIRIVRAALITAGELAGPLQ